MDCLPEWVDLLDQGEAAACLPYQNIINPAVVEGFTTALGVPMQPADDFYGYASPDPFGSPPICNATPVVEDCKYSTKATRTMPDGTHYPVLTDGECTKASRLPPTPALLFSASSGHHRHVPPSPPPPPPALRRTRPPSGSIAASHVPRPSR